MPEYFKSSITKEYLKEFYKTDEGFSWSYETISGYKEFPSLRKYEVIIDLIRKFKPKNILDNGCGGGIFLRELTKEDFNVIGIDLSHKLLSKIPKENLNFPLFAGSSERLFFKENTFDLVLCTEVLEHLIDFKLALREIHFILKKGGKVIITVPNLYCYDSLEGKYKIISKLIKVINNIRFKMKKEEIYKFGYNTHLHKMSPTLWKNNIENEGLKIIYQRPVFISPYIPEGFSFFKKMENFLYSKKSIFKIQGFFEKYLSRIYPFSILGQLHLFVGEKND